MRFWILPALGLFLAPFFADSFLAHHDTLSVYQYFAVYYRQYFLTGEGPLWLQAGYEGIPSDYFHWTFLSPAGLLTAFLGKLFGVTATVPLFSFSVALETLIFVTGLHALVKLFTEDERAALFTALAALFTIYWDAQIFFNFRFMIWTPWFLWALFKFAKQAELGYFLLLPPIFILGLVGELLYLVGVYFWMYLGIFIAVMAHYRPWEAARLRVQILRPRNFALALFGLLLVAGYGYCLSHVMDETVNYNQGRDPLTQKVLYGSFLNYGAPTATKPLEFLLGYPEGSVASGDVNFTAYFGTTAFLLALYAFFFVGGFTANLLKVLSLVCLWIAIPGLNRPIASLLYELPLMGYYRHLGAFIVPARFFLIVLAGMGFAQLRPAPRFWAGLLALTVIAGGAVMWISHGVWPYATFLRVQPEGFEKVMPWLAIAVTCSLMIGLSIKPRRWVAAVFLCLALIEGLSFQIVMSEKARLLRPALKSGSYEVKPFPRTSRRLAQEQKSPAREDLEAFADRWPYIEAMTQTFLDLEMCESPARQNVANRNLDDLFRARFGLTLGDLSRDLPDTVMPSTARWLNNRSPVPSLSDGWMTQAMGCGHNIFRFAQNAQVFASASGVADAVRNAKPGDGDFIEDFAVSHDPARAKSASGLGGTILVTATDANETSLTVDAKGDSWLINGAGFHPGWKVWVDGEPASLHRVNFSYLGVRIPIGVHDVRFRFEGTKTVFIRGILEKLLILSTVLAILGGLFVFLRSSRSVR